ncbi:transmembrane protein 107 [Hydra vulgaris]|uniref:Transmembrane protein 107 n=2 Tax=Hydra vulgaris TaxID=6087 RepID=A0ABM4BX37_HYDVU|nr:transmembrane protein 107 [Hydra vulgaris]
MNAAGSFIPVRFLALISHFVILVTVFWSLDITLKTCLLTGYTDQEYADQERKLTIGFSISIALFIFEMLSFLSGVSMFHSSVAMISIITHVSASISLSMFVLEYWTCDRFWYIFGFCSAFPASLELVTLMLFMICKKRY